MDQQGMENKILHIMSILSKMLIKLLSICYLPSKTTCILINYWHRIMK